MAWHSTRAIEGIETAMHQLRESMKGIQIRSAGFKRDHDELARAVSNFVVDLSDVSPLLNRK